MHISVRRYFIHTVYLLHVSATHLSVIRDVHYKEWEHRNVTDVFVLLHSYYCIGFCLSVQCTDVNQLKYNDFIY